MSEIPKEIESQMIEGFKQLVKEGRLNRKPKTPWEMGFETGRERGFQKGYEAGYKDGVRVGLFYAEIHRERKEEQ